MTATMTERDQAYARKHTCVRCLRGQHDACTARATCMHHGCDGVATPAPSNGNGNGNGARPASPVKENPVADAPDGMVWEEPPSGRRGRHAGPVPTLEQARALRARPGEWARIKTFEHKSTAGSLRARIAAGKIESPAGDWEFISRKHGDRGSALYCRAVPE